VARQGLRFPLRLFSVPSSQPQRPPSIIAPQMGLPMIVGRSLTWRSLAAILAAARRRVAHPAAMPAPLHQIAGDELLRTTTRSSGESTKFSALVFFILFRPVCSSPLPLFVAVAQDSIGEQPGRACSNHLA
jgi:hypothetical protein